MSSDKGEKLAAVEAAVSAGLAELGAMKRNQLDKLQVIGAHLNVAVNDHLIPHGNFESWCRTKWGLSRTKAWNIRKLALPENWARVVAWAEALGKEVAWISLDQALRVIDGEDVHRPQKPSTVARLKAALNQQAEALAQKQAEVEALRAGQQEEPVAEGQEEGPVVPMAIRGRGGLQVAPDFATKEARLKVIKEAETRHKKKVRELQAALMSFAEEIDVMIDGAEALRLLLALGLTIEDIEARIVAAAAAK